VLWFDGEWPHSPEVWQSAELVRQVRQLQPGILINNRLGMRPKTGPTNAEGLGEAADLGDFGTPEHHITADPNRLWESCQVSTWRLWGWTSGERWRPVDLLLDMLTEAAAKGGNLLLNVGPKPDGQLPPEFVERADAIGDWMTRNGEAIYNTDGGELFDFTTFGRTTRRGNHIFLIFRFWDGTGTVRFPGLATKVRRATLLSNGQDIDVRQDGEFTILTGLPAQSPEKLFPVIRLECEGKPQSTLIGRTPQWTGDPRRYLAWANARGTGVMADGSNRPV
jgi:alpha-L-fucosidase